MGNFTGWVEPKSVPSKKCTDDHSGEEGDCQKLLEMIRGPKHTRIKERVWERYIHRIPMDTNVIQGSLDILRPHMSLAIGKTSDLRCRSQNSLVWKAR